jgi:hypothetical protein
MRTRSRLWLTAVLLLSTGAYAVAEDILLTAYHTSPRGFYRSIRTTNTTLLSTSLTGLTRIGTLSALPGMRLEVVGAGAPLFHITGQLRLPCPVPLPVGCVDRILVSIDGGGNAEWRGLSGTFAYF